MFTSLKFFFILLCLAAGALSFLVGYQEWRWVQRLLLGKERLQAWGTRMANAAFIAVGAGLVILGLWILF